MLIALDYDDTYTRNPVFWNKYIALCKSSGHDVICCTMRYPSESVELPIPVHYTSRQQKREYLQRLEIFPHVWIDDTPEFIGSRRLIGG